MYKRFVFFCAALAVANCLFSQAQEGTKANIQGKNGLNWVLDKGAADGVTIGIKGYFWTKAKSGDKFYPMNIARFRVVKLEDKKCLVFVEGIGEGFSEKNFEWAAFNDLLKAPGAKPPPPKPDITVNLEVELWNSIKKSKKAEDYQVYLSKYPNGTFAELAKNRLHDLTTPKPIPEPPKPTPDPVKPTLTPTPKPTPIPTVHMFDLADNLIAAYQAQLQSVSVEGVPIFIEMVNGLATLVIGIDEKGKGTLTQYNDAALNVEPASERHAIQKLIAGQIAAIAFTAPTDKSGKSVRLEGLRLVVKIMKYQSRLILKKQ